MERTSIKFFNCMLNHPNGHMRWGGGYKRILALLLVPALFLGAAVADSPTNKATAGMYGTAQDTVSSKTGMSSIEFNNVFVYGNYATESINIGAATRFSDVWVGFEYSGNFLNNTSSDVDDPLGTLGSKDTAAGYFSESNPSNTLKTTVHLANMPFPMGFHVGFTLGGKYEAGEFTFTDKTISKPSDYDNTYERGYKNSLTYTPSLGYKISIPLGDFTISPAIQLDLGIAQNDGYAKFTQAGNTSSLEQKQLTYLPLTSVQVDTDLPPWGAVSHSVGVQYDFSGSFAQNTTFTKEDTAGTTVTEIKAEQKQGHLAILRYTQKLPVTERVRLGWQFRLSTEFSNQIFPDRMVYNTNTGWQPAGGTETVTTINGGTPLKTGDGDNRVYETTINSLSLVPLFKFGLQWDVMPAKLVFNAGVEFEPFTFSRTDMKTVVKETLSSPIGTAKTAEKTDITFDTPLGKFATGLTLHIAPTVVLDTALALDINRRSISNLTANTILNHSLMMLSLNISL